MHLALSNKHNGGREVKNWYKWKVSSTALEYKITQVHDSVLYNMTT